MSTQTYLLCDLCNTYHARDIQQLNRHKRRDCEGSSTLTSRFYESDDEVDYFAPSDYVGGQLSDSDNSGDVADAVNLGPIIYNYSGRLIAKICGGLDSKAVKIRLDLRVLYSDFTDY
ncbi:hypothetical protein G6F56_012880 [Rhizopus delemar]|nr:hypothetical protein G6F56_012880 [Rhizopus delemar]